MNVAYAINSLKTRNQLKMWVPSENESFFITLLNTLSKSYGAKHTISLG